MSEEKFQIKVLVASLAIVVAAVLASGDGFAANVEGNTTITARVGSTISISSLGNVNISVTPSGGDARLSSARDIVTVSSNNSTGYNLNLEMFDDETSLLNGANAIAQGAGNLTTPSALTSNTWGYRVANAGGFGPGAAVETNVATSAYSWAGVPANGSPDQVKSTGSEADNDTTNIWYAIMADSNRPSGTYTGRVTYTATTNSP
ncbi:MAG: hypothetical protein ACOX0Z_00245 [Candidatus Nanosyncoccaceae bacterium]|jgi:hypothetical protein